VCTSLQQEGSDKFLYFADAYHGIFKLNLATQRTTHLIAPNTKIIAPPVVDYLALQPMLFFNDLDVFPNGNIAFSDSSYKFTRSENRPEILDGAGRGRLLVYSQQHKQLQLVLCGLHFPNGVQRYFTNASDAGPVAARCGSGGRLTCSSTDGSTSETAAAAAIDNFVVDGAAEETKVSQAGSEEISALVKKGLQEEEKKVEEEVVLVNELTRFRVLKVDLARAIGHSETLLASCTDEGRSGLDMVLRNPYGEAYGVTPFLSNIPGLVDNVRADVLFSPAAAAAAATATTRPCCETTENDASSSCAAAPTPSVYYLFGLGSKSVQPFSLLWMVLQYGAVRRWVGSLVPMRWVEHLVPRYGLVVVANDRGEMVHALHDPSGRVAALLSQAERHPLTGDLWLGSHSERLSILPAASVPASWTSFNPPPSAAAASAAAAAV
jgi:hypothetical protein